MIFLALLCSSLYFFPLPLGDCFLDPFFNFFINEKFIFFFKEKEQEKKKIVESSSSHIKLINIVRGV